MGYNVTNKRKADKKMEELERDVVVFTDDDGNEIELDVIDYFEHDGQELSLIHIWCL